MLSNEFRLHRVGGLGSHVAALAPRLADILPVHLVVPRYNDKGEYTEPLGRYGRVYRVDAAQLQAGPDFDRQVWRMNDQLNSFIRRELLPRQHYALIHGHDWLTGYAVNDLHRSDRIPQIVTIHATEYGRMSGNIHANPLSERIHLAEQYLAQHADAIIACSAFMRQEISSALRVDSDKIFVVPNGVDVAAVLYARHDPALQAWRRQWAADDSPLLFFVGRLVGDKGPDLLVAAMPQILQHMPTAKAVVAGKGPYMDHLRGMIDSLGLRQHVHLPGFVSDDDLRRFYAVADVAVFPSRYEPFGIVALEAMLAGTPVVVSQVGGLQEVVEDGVSGWHCAPGRADALAETLLAVLSQPQEAARRAAHAQSLVRERYSWQNIAQQTLHVYKTICQSC